MAPQKPKGKLEARVQTEIKIGNAQIRFKNFEGKAGTFNAKGQRNFCVLIDDDIAVDLKNIGWNIKYLKPREEDEKPQAYLQVKVSYGNIPPMITLVTSRSKKILEEKDVHILDWAEIKKVDLIIRPYNWEAQEKKGVAAYVKTMYVTIVEDEFASKYENVPDSAQTVLLEEEGD
jgi:hypothetical protein